MAGLDERAAAAIDWLTDRVLTSLANDETVDPVALTLLVRRYGATDRADLADALGPALGRAVERERLHESAAGQPGHDPAWLTLFAEASALSDDARLRDAAADLMTRLRQRWGRSQAVEPLALSVDACLIASDLFDPQELVPNAVDELERIVGAGYVPGAGIAHDVSEPDGARGRLGDHVRAASALLTAYELTGRLPYAMLAEELIQFARRTLWDEQDGGFYEQAGARVKPFALNCEAARVLCRLAALHRLNEYAAKAVVAPDADYGRDAARTLSAFEPSYRDYGANAAIYAVALGEWLGLR
jgi:mannose/cellobiose epimerase-like protein (N-acyl-D-glucosamine 2-epimerase family)